MKRVQNPNKFRRQVFTGYWMVMLTVLLVCVLLEEFFPPIFSPILVAFVIGGTIVVFGLYIYGWRCPFCGEMLPRSGDEGLSFCPYCGKQLPTDDG